LQLSKNLSSHGDAEQARELLDAALKIDKERCIEEMPGYVDMAIRSLGLTEDPNMKNIHDRARAKIEENYRWRFGLQPMGAFPSPMNAALGNGAMRAFSRPNQTIFEMLQKANNPNPRQNTP
ncbi:MAG: hypothetical protein K2Z81_00545, partial [Cyanobacteria bacterium]|nr:hypothetical protein [Cyanobacteriota bacterium]